ncbi:phage portal protein [Sphingobium sp. DC-2]|uniref:phage portal protein n=1 Tax=Sphingobium sp. DC-2 TaxID=1303256 RepID=UPI00056AAA1A|nr:phage portal protein [Sphingobium sp. DC-2]
MSPDDYVRQSRARTETRSIEDPTSRLSENPEALLSMLGVLDSRGALPPVSIDAALGVPAVMCAVGFLSRALASLPLQAFRGGEGGEKIDGNLAMLLNEAPNEEVSSFEWRRHKWQQVFTGGRGMSWIERAGVKPVALWPLDPRETTIIRRDGRKYYRNGGREYPARDVIDVTFMPKSDLVGHYSPIFLGRKAIALALAMNDFAGSFFASGGVPPLALEGPLPQGAEAFKRAQADINRAIDLAKRAGAPFFGMPPGHKLNPIGIEPAKGQMTEARLFQIQEVARIWGLPPVFVQDLSKGTFSNTEQQDLQLVKHTLGQWAKAFEDELNLKLFGQRRRSRKVKHNLDGMQRGAFKDRIEGIARAIMTGQMTPDEGRALEDRPADPSGAGAKLYIQGATVPLGTTPPVGNSGKPPINDNKEDGDYAGTQTDD